VEVAEAVVEAAVGAVDADRVSEGVQKRLVRAATASVPTAGTRSRIKLGCRAINVSALNVAQP
jgi:hypothetical protein